MNVVDSCGWLEYFAGGPNAEFFAGPVENVADLLVPSICLSEVFRRVCQQRGEREAMVAVANMQQGRVVDLDTRTAATAARVGLDEGLPLADSIVLATARLNGAIVWTQDADFDGLADVRYTPSK